MERFGAVSYTHLVAEVPARRAHAWAEIWVPDFGWVPVESTPGGDAVPLGSAASAENGGADAPGTVEDEGEDPGEDAETPEESAQASEPVDLDPTAGSGEGAGALWWILPICAAAGVGALFLIPAARRAKRSRILQHADRRQAVLCPVSYTHLLKNQMGFLVLLLRRCLEKEHFRCV